MKDTYNASLDADEQITAEEQIAAYLYDTAVTGQFESEEGCADAGRHLLKLVLKQFRPDVFAD